MAQLFETLCMMLAFKESHSLAVHYCRLVWDVRSLRKMIYTTNQIENFNRQLRKVSKSRTIFPTDDSLFKLLYLATIDITKKWSGRNRDWNKIISQLCIYFADRIEPADLE